MEFGVSFQSHIGRTYKHAILAEAVGLDQAWFIDSQLIASDVYAVSYTHLTLPRILLV